MNKDEQDKYNITKLCDIATKSMDFDKIRKYCEIVLKAYFPEVSTAPKYHYNDHNTILSGEETTKTNIIGNSEVLNNFEIDAQVY